MIRTILVPTDFSLPADDAAHYALKLAKKFQASLILYHSFIPFESGFYTEEQRKKENRETEKRLTQRLDQIKISLMKSEDTVSVSIHVGKGPENKRITEFCKKKRIDLIVMGTKGASGIKEVVIGSFTADVMKNASCPVLAIPQHFKFKTLKKITYCSGYHDKESSAIHFLAEWNQIFKTKINILHIDDEAQASNSEEEFTRFKQKFEKQYKHNDLSFQHISGDDISKSILQITLNDKTDILAISPLKRKDIWDRLFHKSITKKTACHIRIPLLSIPIK